MRIFALFCLTALSAALVPGCSSPVPRAAAKAPERDARLDWWRDARFGMFIHWGLYAIPAGEWGGGTDHAEWIRTTARIPVAKYEEFRAQWNPSKFDADAWARIAKDAGVQYVTITTKHHDGFCLFDSAYTDWDVMSTPFHRDVMKELSDAVGKQGLHMCWYHSIMDWHHPDYLPRRDWEKDRTTEGASFDRYVEYLHHQVTELLTKYGPIGVMWFDGEWESTWNHAHGKALYELCRNLQPNVIVNNRVDVGRSGMAGMTSDGEFCGDFGTPEQEVPATGFPGVDWESCMTMNDHWGYNAHDKNFKSTRELVRTLVDIASKGGNFLLNVGPTAEGLIPPESVERLAAMGRWMKVNGDAIYGTQASPIEAPPFGRVTCKPDGARTRLYLHVFDWPKDGALRLGGIGNELGRAWLLADPPKDLTVSREGADVVVTVPPGAPDADCSVVALELYGAPIVYKKPAIVAPASSFVRTMEVQLDAGSPALSVRYTLDGSDPNEKSPAAAVAPITAGSSNGTVRIDKSCTLRARSFHGGKPVSGVSERRFQRVVPRLADLASRASPGLARATYEGAFDRMPDFTKLTPVAQGVVPKLALDPGPAKERIAQVFAGYVRVPADDVYVIALSSDDGSRLYIGDVLVVDNDGLHSSVEKRGEIALAQGLHALRVEWFNKTGSQELTVRIGRGGAEPTSIAAPDLVHVGD
jgi:alpha-L-fucosidase